MSSKMKPKNLKNQVSTSKSKVGFQLQREKMRRLFVLKVGGAAIIWLVEGLPRDLRAIVRASLIGLKVNQKVKM